VAKGVAGGTLPEADLLHRGADGALHNGLVQVMPAPPAALVEPAETGSWEHPLPRPLSARRRELSRERVGQENVTRAARKVAL
jgi:hypothetical protein